FMLLSAAYRRGDLSSVYPIARGTAPLLATGAGLVVLGERLTAPQAAGVAALLIGIWTVRRPSAGAASGLAVLTGVAIATYSSIDAVAVRGAPPWLYAWLLWVLTSGALTAVAALRRGPVGAADPEAGRPPPGWGVAAAAGVLMTGAYVPILFAFSMAPLALVAPLRESGIVLAAGWGVLRLGERERWGLRLAGAALVLAGVVLLAY
ncbi:MAG: EamA family transporter, partial [Candidatus Dormibacterales bacterium]